VGCATSWYQLLDIRKHARQEWHFWNDRPPIACPIDGQPLLTGPTSQASTLYCPFDGWQWPRDWIQPSEPIGLFGGLSSAEGSYPGPGPGG